MQVPQITQLYLRRIHTLRATKEFDELPTPLNMRIDVMNTLPVVLTRFTAAAFASVITAVGAWAFVSSSASTERDPFHFADAMAANAQVRSEQLQSRNTIPACRHESPSSGHACLTVADLKAAP